MYKLVLALALGVATAFTPAPVARSATRLAGAKDDLVDLAESNTDALGAAIGLWVAADDGLPETPPCPLR